MDRSRQLVRRRALQQIAANAEFHQLPQVGALFVYRQHENPAFRVLGAQSRGKLDAVHLGQRNVHHNDIRDELPGQPEGGPAVARLTHDGEIRIGADQRLQAGEHDRMIVDHQDAHRSRCHDAPHNGMRT